MGKLKYHLKVLFDNTAVLAIIFIGYAILFGGLVFKYSSIQYHTAALRVFKAFSMPFAYFHFALVGMIALLYFSIEERVFLEEALVNGIKKKCDRGKAVVILLFNGLVFLLVFLLTSLFYFFRANPSSLYFRYLQSMFYREFFDYFLLGVISCQFGYLIAKCKKKKWQIIYYLLYQFIFGYPMLWISDNFALSSTDNQLIGFLLNMTSMMPDGYTFDVNGYSIYPVQIYQIILALFWIVFLYWCGIICRKVKNTKKIIVWGGCVLSAALFALCFVPHTAIGGGKRILYTYQRISEQMDSKTVGREMEKAPFEVTSYDIKINALMNLSATVEAEVSDSQLDQYVFTLYDGYDILKIEDQDGKAMDYSRDGHYLTVFPAGETSVIRFTYFGAGDPFYCEASAIWLPNGLPFFPMAGKVPVYEDNKDGSVAFNNNHLPQETFFHVRVNAPGEVYCPLDKIGNNEFSGYGDGFFILKGMYDKVVYDGLEIIYPYATDGGVAALDEEQVRECLEIISDRIGEDVFAQSQGRIFLHQGLFTRPIDVYSDYVSLSCFYPEVYQNLLDDYLEQEGLYYDHD